MDTITLSDVFTWLMVGVATLVFVAGAFAPLVVQHIND